MRRIILSSALILLASSAISADWPMWGGTPSRNMVSDMKGLPTTWDLKTGKNVKWAAELGSQSYGNPTVADGVVMVGTNNEAMRDPKQPGDRGVLMAFNEDSGEFMWQATFEKLTSGRANDWPYQGIASSPTVVRGIAYFTSNRGQIIAADLKGFHDGENDGPYRDEPVEHPDESDVVWRLDMMAQLGVSPHNMSTCCPLIVGDRLFVCTSGRWGRGVSRDSRPRRSRCRRISDRRR